MQDLAESPVWAILMVCRNRRDTTLKALRCVATQDRAAAHRIILFDDASTDGTVESVAAEFPTVTIVNGDGKAFWNGGLYRAWTEALDAQVNGFLWLNDDVELEADAFARLSESWRALATRDKPFILVGATRGDHGEVSYGGMRWDATPFAFRLSSVAPSDTFEAIDTFNGNIVLVPRTVVERIGINDPAFHHNMGDVDYGLRASRAGISVLLLPGTLGHCALNETKRSRGYGARGLSVSEQWRKVNTHHGLPFASWWRMTRRHSGKWWLFHFLLPYRWLVLPWQGQD